MFLTQPLPDDIRSSHWRNQPMLLKGMIDPAHLSSFTVERFYSWCRQPARARLYSRTEDFQPGTAVAGLLPDVEGAPALFEPFRREEAQATLLLNHAELVEPDLVRLREELGIGLSWRYDDVVATLSTVESGIGYHAGHEDGFIAQLRGSREWALYACSELPEQYRNRLLGDRRQGNPPAPPRPDAEPIFSCRLNPGDLLYIPALVGHEGVTLEESISLSIGWKGISVFHCFWPFADAYPGIGAVVDEVPDLFFRLLTDPAPDCADLPQHLLDDVDDVLSYLGPAAPSRDMLKRYFEAMIAR